MESLQAKCLVTMGVQKTVIKNPLTGEGIFQHLTRLFSLGVHNSRPSCTYDRQYLVLQFAMSNIPSPRLLLLPQYRPHLVWQRQRTLLSRRCFRNHQAFCSSLVGLQSELTCQLRTCLNILTSKVISGAVPSMLMYVHFTRVPLYDLLTQKPYQPQTRGCQGNLTSHNTLTRPYPR